MNGNESEDIGMPDWRIRSVTPMPKLGDLKKRMPLHEDVFKKVVRPTREQVCNILTGEDQRKIVIVGPCSIHSVHETIEYAGKLKELIPQISDQFCVIMRACLDKPRTGLGWPGYFLDPDLNGSRNAHIGRKKGRKLLIDIVSMGVPVGLEILDANACQVVDECVSYWWIGARTVTSQRLREIASGLSTAVGFKNPVEGDISGAIEAIETARHDAAFLALNHRDVECLYRTLGNQFGHMILRGTKEAENYDPASVSNAVHRLAQRGLPTQVLIDASHSNSRKDFRRQKEVIAEVVRRISEGERHIAGFFYESYLEEGSQHLPKDLSELKPRISVTDGCDSWDTTREVLLRAHEQLARSKSSPQ